MPASVVLLLVLSLALALGALSPALLLALPLAESSGAARPDLVFEATLRLIPTTPATFLAISSVAGVAALGLTAHNAWLLRTRTARQARDLLALQQRERRLRLAVHDSELGLLHLEPVRDAAGAVRDFVVTDANACSAALLRREATAMAGLHVATDLGLSCDSDLFRGLVETLRDGTTYRGEQRAHPRRAATSWLHVRAVRVEDGLAVTIADIAERKREARRLRRESLVDALTGLVNRRGFLDLGAAQLAAARRQGQDAVLFYLDCDDFKGINDLFGHAVGDRALTEIARALRAGLRETDVIARLGGDEFTVLALDAVGACADAIRARVNARLDALNHSGVLPAAVSVTIGHVYVPASGTASLADLLHEADMDLLHRKAARRAARSAMAAIATSTRSPRRRPAAVVATPVPAWGRGPIGTPAPSNAAEFTGGLPSTS
jgi:diguanylate cyclase (GGDEF)-like protein